MSDREYDNTNRGALFKNDKKESDRHPDYRGSINIDGKEFWLDAWLKTSKAGKKFMSLSVKPKMAREHQGGTDNPPARYADKGAGDPF
jgi:uncharacterized protein (DUF736 family)